MTRRGPKMSAFDFNETALRMGVFAAILLAMSVLEIALPRKALTQTKTRRWATNFLIVVLDSLLVRFTFPLVAVGAAFMAESKGWGLFHLVGLPDGLAAIAGFLFLDFAIYFQHVISHKVPLFWRLHQVHHADPDIDVSTALRFHPIEIMLSMVYKIALVFLIGIPPLAVLIFEIVLNGAAMFNHANVAIPQKIERWLRWFIVTPDMHRVHHSNEQHETDSNYGFNLSIWDRMFGTYIDQPGKGHDGMVIGLRSHPGSKPTELAYSLLMPFRRLGKKRPPAKMD